MSGSYILITMYDDRLEILSPGKLPNIVTVDNIKTTRYSRNPKISRVLTDFGWVKELNEGVKRIYSEMEEYFLDDPIYTEPEYAVKLVLKNNYVMRTIRQANRLEKVIDKEVWGELDEYEKDILAYMNSCQKVTRKEIEKHLKKSSRMILTRLNHLIDLNLIKRNGNKYDSSLTYEIIHNS